MKIKIFAKSVSGTLTNKKQDEVFYWKNKFDNFMFGICDGVGSYEDSHIGVKIARDVLEKEFLNIDMSSFNKLEIKKWGENILNKKIHDKFTNIFTKIAITITFSILIKKYIYIFHIGDTRAYQKKFKNSSTHQLTEDHTSKAENFLTYGKKNFLLNSLSNKKSFYFDFFSISIFEGFLFFTSDGIHDFISVKEFNEIFNNNKLPVQDIIYLIFQKTNSLANKDDKSLLIVKLNK